MSDAWLQAFGLVFHPLNLVVMLGAAAFGLFVGAVPGLTATMATALLVPVTFFMAPIPAVAAIVTATAMAIFAGDIPGLPDAHAGDAGVGRVHRRGVRDDAQGAGGARARRGPRVLGVRRSLRHRRADSRGADARRVRAEVQLVRVLLARAARPHLRGLHDVGPAAQGLRVAAARPPGRVDRSQQSGGDSALHVRQHRAARRRRADSDDDRHVRDLGSDPLRGRHEPAAARRGKERRQRVQGRLGAREEVPAAAPARQRARHARRRAARRRRRHRGMDGVRHQPQVVEGAAKSTAPAMSRASSRRARRTTPRSPAPGSRRSCSAFPATRSPRSSSACCT